ncbi:spore germination protein [Paenibacillus sp. N3/727]|uniref:GerAB/ArcD/ProY family transporter n=1 Tax=Paenibacillus sp. N3/727 TaxID=2925845 RepID=UPI001F533DB1|nr:endospore germination permease [Paenibacillus sp. N3/727]UNK16381.1 spore germination protein [Paenibacillus sp. N3/727]
MMTHSEKMLSKLQFFFFIIQAQIGVGVLSIPHELNNNAMGGSGLSVLIAGFVTQMIIFILWFLLKKYPGLSLFHICLKLCGPVIGRLLIVCYIGHFILLAANILLSTVDVLQSWILLSTPKWVLLGLFSIMALYLAREKLTVLARFYALASFLFVPLIFFVSYGLTQSRVEYMFPLLEAGYMNIVKGAKDATISMYGFEMMLIIFPYTQGSNKQRLMTISLANLFVTLFYTFVVVTCVMVFNTEQLRLIPEPVIYLMKSLNFYVFDRADVLFLPIWAITLVCSIVSYCYAPSIGLTVLFKRSNHKNFAPYVIIVSYIIALFPITPIAIHQLDRAAEYSAYLFIVGIPFVMMILSLFVKRKAGELA